MGRGGGRGGRAWPGGLAGMLLGRAGLLDQATLPEAHAWRALQRQRGLRPALRRASWDRRELRAANAPAQRCRGLAELAARWAHRPVPAPLNRPSDLVRRANGMRRPGLWRFVRASPWVGHGRAQVIAVNVLLPFAAAAGVVEAAELFERLPGEPTNRVVRYMAELLGGPDVRFRGACQQQGLLHLFKVTCASRSCELLPGPWRRTRPAGAVGVKQRTPPELGHELYRTFRKKSIREGSPRSEPEGAICNPCVGQERLDEVHPFALVGRRQTSPAPSAYQSGAGDAHAGLGARSQNRAAFERADGFATQEARQLNPFRPPDARASLDQFCRHYSHPTAADGR